MRLFVRETTKFKTSTLKLFIHRNLDEGTTPAAIVPFVLRRGCRGFPTHRDISRELEQLYGASLGVDILKSGERQILCFRLDCLGERFKKGRRSPLDRALSLLSNIVWNTVDEGGNQFSTASFELEKRNLRRMVEAIIDEKMRYASERLIQEMCREEPYAVHEYGTLETIDELTNEAAFEGYQKLLRTAPMDIFVVGDLTLDQVEEMVLSRVPFADRNGPFSKIKPPIRKRPGRGRTVIEEHDVNQAKLAMGYRTDVFPDDTRYPALLVGNSILGGGTFSKIFKNVREKKQLAYYTHSMMERVKGLIFIHSGIDSQQFSAAVKVIKKQVSDLRSGRITDDELDGAKKALVNRFRTIEDSAGRMINDALEILIAGRRQSGATMLRALPKVDLDQVVDACDGIRLDTTFFLREAEGASHATRTAARSSMGRLP